jgi:hypothetical protein
MSSDSTGSYLLLLFLGVCGCLFGSFLFWKNERNFITAFLNAAIGPGIYLILSHFRISPSFYTCIIVVFLLLGLSGIWSILQRPKKERESRQQYWKRKSRALGRSGMRILGLELSFLLAITATYRLANTLCLPANTFALQDRQEYTIEQNRETLLLFRQSKWNTLDLSQKLAALQTIANIEQQYLQLPHSLHVGTRDLAVNVIGQYNDTGQYIQLDTDRLLYSSSYELLEAVSHEAFHAYEYRLISKYSGENTGYEDFQWFADPDTEKARVEQYKEEFENYAYDGLEYSKQFCESDARDYAAMRFRMYFQQISLAG